MSAHAPLHEDLIDAVFRPVIGFFVGTAIGYTAQLAQVTGWVIALTYLGVLALIVVVGVFMYERMHRMSDWVFEKIGIAPRVKPQMRPLPKRRKHWFVRYGWIIGTGIGIAAVYIWPEGLRAWL